MNGHQHLEFLRRRRTRRVFTGSPVTLEAVLRCVEAATLAPSGANSQPWEFVLIPPGERRRQMVPMCEKADQRFHDTAPPWLRQFLESHHIPVQKMYFDLAPWLVCVFARRNLPYWLPSVWLSIANFVNQAEAEGLNTVVYTPTLGREFNLLIGVDAEWSFQAMLPVGVADPNEVMEPRPRVPAAEKTRIVTDAGVRMVSDMAPREFA
jgi:nitroreductase